MAHDGVYDVFLSYSWQDRAAIEPIAQALRQRAANTLPQQLSDGQRRQFFLDEAR